MLSPKEVIGDIRETDFGIDLNNTENLPEKIQAYIENNKEFRGEAARIGEEIHSEKAHFVFELIQNADDNDYKKSVEPKIKFIIKSNELIIQNNEKGFKEENVRKLCRIGGSTKIKKSGYIGEKGIGFKSVFMVSDEPHIYSNGFHFKFEYQLVSK